MMKIIKAELDKNAAKPCQFCNHPRGGHNDKKGCMAMSNTYGTPHECLCYSGDGRTRED